MKCEAQNAAGDPCDFPENMVERIGDRFLCPVHRPGGAEWLGEAQRSGGRALAAKLAGTAFTDEDLPKINTVEEAQTRLDMVQRAVLTRRITHNEANAASKAVDSWIKAESVRQTQKVVEDFERVIREKDAEIAQLNQRIADAETRKLKVAS